MLAGFIPVAENQARSQTMNIVSIAASSTGAYTVMHSITTFRSTTDRIYDGGPIILYYNIIQIYLVDKYIIIIYIIN